MLEICNVRIVVYDDEYLENIVQYIYIHLALPNLVVYTHVGTILYLYYIRDICRCVCVLITLLNIFSFCYDLLSKQYLGMNKVL